MYVFEVFGRWVERSVPPESRREIGGGGEVEREDVVGFSGAEDLKGPCLGDTPGARQPVGRGEQARATGLHQFADRVCYVLVRPECGAVQLLHYDNRNRRPAEQRVQRIVERHVPVAVVKADGVMGLGAALTARGGDESRYEAVGHANEVEVVRSAVEEVSHCGDALLVAATKPTFEGMGADIEVRNHES
jgi:hypothetical protein